MEGAWVWLKKHHRINKLTSITISSALAYWTLSYKQMAFRYYNYSFTNDVDKE